MSGNFINRSLQKKAEKQMCNRSAWSSSMRRRASSSCKKKNTGLLDVPGLWPSGTTSFAASQSAECPTDWRHIAGLEIWNTGDVQLLYDDLYAIIDSNVIIHPTNKTVEVILNMYEHLYENGPKILTVNV